MRTFMASHPSVFHAYPRPNRSERFNRTTGAPKILWGGLPRLCPEAAGAAGACASLPPARRSPDSNEGRGVEPRPSLVHPDFASKHAPLRRGSAVSGRRPRETARSLTSYINRWCCWDPDTAPRWRHPRSGRGSRSRLRLPRRPAWPGRRRSSHGSSGGCTGWS